VFVLRPQPRKFNLATTPKPARAKKIEVKLWPCPSPAAYHAHVISDETIGEVKEDVDCAASASSALTFEVREIEPQPSCEDLLLSNGKPRQFSSLDVGECLKNTDMASETLVLDSSNDEMRIGGVVSESDLEKHLKSIEHKKLITMLTSLLNAQYADISASLAAKLRRRLQAIPKQDKNQPRINTMFKASSASKGKPKGGRKGGKVVAGDGQLWVDRNTPSGSEWSKLCPIVENVATWLRENWLSTETQLIEDSDDDFQDELYMEGRYCHTPYINSFPLP
jgi:hypothetical protein